MASRNWPGTGYCTAHQFNVIPLRSGRDVLVAGWTLGGTTVVDFGDPERPYEIAHFALLSRPTTKAPSGCEEALGGGGRIRTCEGLTTRFTAEPV